MHALPVVQDIRAAHPDATVDWMVDPSIAPLLRRVEGLGALIESVPRAGGLSLWSAKARRGWSAFRERLTAQRYDAVIDLQGQARSAWFASMAQGRRYGPASGAGGAALPWPAALLNQVKVAVDPKCHAVERLRRIAGGALGYRDGGTAPRFGLAGRAPKLAHPTIAFVHAASSADRLWPEARWVALGCHFVERGWDVVLSHGREDEQVQAERLGAAIDSKLTAFGQANRRAGPPVQVWPRLKLDAIVDRLAACHGVIGVDSALSHIATALGLPHVRLYNQPMAWRTGPMPGAAHQIAVGGTSVPTQDEVWAAWKRVAAASGIGS